MKSYIHHKGCKREVIISKFWYYFGNQISWRFEAKLATGQSQMGDTESEAVRNLFEYLDTRPDTFEDDRY